ncbi:hypothetical protein [Pectobacterium carotovorum]|uniref:hypothetical protein n=1 Tax=Pectobacterium carotovorum TaxID=554 RepID=UPI00057CE2CA|nr:hypothetical protein [Pectobacterium carotovorum]KHT25447.1 hypothetical protein RC98_17840 [Pectobacterium carotovorum subsp. carotovorum]GKW08888.1 hypothetical protein PEC301889_33700 [Pectobacterium carotovorum subsp. carotovorum]
MRKFYYLTYGSFESKESVKQLLDSIWDISCDEHDSDYLGIYYFYSGIFADKLTIKDNIQHEKNDNFPTLIEISFINGKNTDKLSRYKFIKNVFSELKIASLINDEHISEDV